MQYYYVNSDGNVTGPEGEETLRVLYAKGEIKGDTEVAAVGSAEWTNLSSILNRKARQASKEICPYCRTPAENSTHCQSCGTPHHHECWSQNGGCTVYGCSGAPAEESKIVITGESLAPATVASHPQSGVGHQASGNYSLNDQYGNYPGRSQISRQSHQSRATPYTDSRPYPQATGTSGFAIASLVCSLVGPCTYGLLTLVAIVFGHVAMSEIRNTPGLGGSGLATAGLIIGYLQIALVFLGILSVLANI
jgi:hypothetical protein